MIYRLSRSLLRRPQIEGHLRSLGTRTVFPEVTVNWDLLLNPDNRELLRDNIRIRKGIGDIDRVCQLQLQVQKQPENKQLKETLLKEALKIPNLTHPDVINHPDEGKVVKKVEWKSKYDLKEGIRSFDVISGKIGAGVRTKELRHVTGEKAYYFMEQYAELEQALINYTLDRLLEIEGFELFTVPDLLHPNLLERCGMTLGDGTTRVYQLEKENYGPVALSGTSEMALASYYMGKRVEKAETVTSVSRCFRPEVSYLASESGIYRVHEFTKVEMFSVITPEKSEETLDRFLKIQEGLFDDLGLAYKILDMPPNDLGAPAFRKFDIEAYLPSQDSYGEISSCSNCTDYQSRRLDIRDTNGEFLHTVNGTACAVPRMIMALCEQNQTKDGLVHIPEVLRKYMRNATTLVPGPKETRPRFMFIKSPKSFVGKTVAFDMAVNEIK